MCLKGLLSGSHLKETFKPDTEQFKRLCPQLRAGGTWPNEESARNPTKGLSIDRARFFFS
jgi:hypothetical protein